MGTVRSIPDVLGGTPYMADRMLGHVGLSTSGHQVVVDLAAVTWICPYGAALLFHACRMYAAQTGSSVQLRNIQPNVHAYLERIDFFTFDVAAPDVPLASTAALSRSPASTTVVEISAVRTHHDVYEIVGRARHILDTWFEASPSDIDSIVSLLSEACGNIVDHSEDWGIVTIQKYDRGNYIDVELAISDLGQGVQRSLLRRYPDLRDTPSGFLLRALDGLSAREGERGGQGLGAMERIASGRGGYLHLRSNTASIQAQGGVRTPYDGLADFPGMHVGIRFRSLR